MKTIVVLSGAGISAESGIRTFRESDGLWEEHRVEDVATFEAWQRNQELVLDFYNQRRKQLYEVLPNAAHYALVELEKKFNVEIITQNVDDLHEMAGSKSVMHLHGELKKVRSTVDANLIYELKGWELKKGDLCEKGSQLRPHIVWFGEEVPQIIPASSLVGKADIFMIIGTSMNVYPAAGLISYAPSSCLKYLIDPNAKENYYVSNLNIIKEKAGIGVPKLVEELLKD
jgi:NAD-dependent deacetylase